MKKLSGQQSGNVLPIVVLVLLLIVVTSFAVWAFGGRQDYKNNVDAKIATAVAANTQKVQADDAKQAAEAAKNPLQTYTGPDAYGSVKVAYPKTWSVYVDTSGSSDAPLDVYFHDGFVPSVESKQPYNLRVQVAGNSYSDELANFSSQTDSGNVKVAPYSLPKLPKVGGSIVTGQINSNDSTQTGTLVLLPLRDKTLKIWTESPNFMPDFNTYILPNLTFSP